MLKCIICGGEMPEQFNLTQHEECADDEHFTTLYSTKMPYLNFPESPCDEMISFDTGEHVWYKREDKNAISQSFKDRKSAFIKNISPISQKFALASCGNQALSLAKTFRNLADNTYLYLPSDISYEKLKDLRSLYKDISFVDRILSTSELAQNESNRWNLSNGQDPIGGSAVYTLGFELENFDFDTIFVPMGSGELYSYLSVYLKILRKKNVNVVPVKCHHPLAEAIRTDFIPMQPFIDYFGVNPVVVSNIESISNSAEQIGCSFSSAVVFEAYKQLKPEGRTCLVVTGAK